MQPQYVADRGSCRQAFDASAPQTRPVPRNRCRLIPIQGIFGPGYLQVTEPMIVTGINPGRVTHNRRARCPRASKRFLHWDFWQASPLVRRPPRRKKSSLSSRPLLSRNRCTTSTTDGVLAGRALLSVRHIAATPAAIFFEPLCNVTRTQYCEVTFLKGRLPCLEYDCWPLQAPRRWFWPDVHSHQSRKWRERCHSFPNPAKRFVSQVILCPVRIIRRIFRTAMRSVRKATQLARMWRSARLSMIADVSRSAMMVTTVRPRPVGVVRTPLVAHGFRNSENWGPR